MFNSFEIDIHAPPSLPPGMSVARHLKSEQKIWVPGHSRLYFPQCHENSGKFIGHKMYWLVAPLRPYNANHLDLLLENQGAIPDSWRYQYVFFWGTIYRIGNDNFCVRYLRLKDDGSKFESRTHHFDFFWGNSYPAAIPTP